MLNHPQISLARKLGIKSGMNLLLVNRPAHYFSLFDDFPSDVQILKGGRPQEVDIIHLFVTSLEELRDRIIHLVPLLHKDGCLWISWLTATSETTTDLQIDAVTEYLRSIGLVDVEVWPVDKGWTSLKYVHKVKDKNV